jgi:phosphate transport system substrate-binding protein
VKWNPNFREYVETKEATNDTAGAAVISQRMYEALEKDKYGIGWGALMHVNGTCINPDGTKCPGYRGLKVIALSKAPDGPAVPLTADNVKNLGLPADSRCLHMSTSRRVARWIPRSANSSLRAEPRRSEIIQN